MVFGVVGLAKIERVVEVGYEVKAEASGYLVTGTGALALGGTGPAVIEGGPMYWVITLPGAGLAPKGVLFVSVKIPAGTDLKAAVARVIGYKIR